MRLNFMENHPARRFRRRLLVAGVKLARRSPRRRGMSRSTTRRAAKVGGVIFADYTCQDKPEVTDSNHNTIHQNAFNVSRAYLQPPLREHFAPALGSHHDGRQAPTPTPRTHP